MQYNSVISVLHVVYSFPYSGSLVNIYVNEYCAETFKLEKNMPGTNVLRQK